MSDNDSRELVARLKPILQAERWDEAIGLIEGSSFFESSYELLWNLGWAYFRSERYELSIRVLEKALALEPADPSGRWALGEAYSMVGSFAEAEVELLRSLAFRDGYPARCALGLLYHRTGRLIEAETVYQEMVRLRPSSKQRLELYATFLQDCGRDAEAAEYFARAQDATQK